jgi:hypothetical protein
MEPRAELADNNISGVHILTAEMFDTAPLASGIAAVSRASNTFLMCHI